MKTVVVTEGEKSADALYRRGMLAVGTVTGASGCPGPESLSALRGFDVVLWPDEDAVGKKHMEKVGAALKGLGIASRTLQWAEAPPKGDAADYTGTDEELAALIAAAGSGVDRSVPRLSVVWANELELKPISWLWRGRLAKGKPTLLMGDPGLGKSLITHWVAATVSVGGAWPDGGVSDKGTAILFTTEDGLEDTVGPRLAAAGADMSRVAMVQGVIDKDADDVTRMFALTEHIAMLEELIVQTGAVFISMDPISSYLGPDVNSHKDSDVRAVLGPLSLLAERTGVALLMLIHLNKGSNVQALYRATGAVAFPAIARMVLGVAPDPNDEDGKRRLLLPIKMNIGKLPQGIGYRIETAARPEGHAILKDASEADQPPEIHWDMDPVAIDMASAMDRNGSAQELGAVAETKAALLEILKGGRALASTCKREIKESVGTTSETILSRARKELGVKVRREGFGPGSVWYWYPPETVEPIDLARARVEINESMESMESMEATIDFENHSLISENQSLIPLIPLISDPLPRAREELPRGVASNGQPLCEPCRARGVARGVVPGQYLCRECMDLAEWTRKQREEGRPE